MRLDHEQLRKARAGHLVGCECDHCYQWSQRHRLWIDEQLAKERRDREAREVSWDIVSSTLSHLDANQITLEHNPLLLDDGGAPSYLEQAHINLPEVYPGCAEAMVQCVRTLLLELLPNLARDRLTDEERIKIGWLSDPYRETVDA